MQAPVWKGLAERLTTEDFGAVAAASGVETAALRAIWEVEAANKPFRADGSVERRFEPHHFPELASLGWSWKRSLKVSAKDREAMFAAAYADQPEQALRATSFGGPQIMGFNAEAAGYLSATDMVRDFARSERAQLDAMIRLARSWGLIAALRAHDWLTFARRWNGNGQPEVYARRIEAASGMSGSNSAADLIRLYAFCPAKDVTVDGVAVIIASASVGNNVKAVIYASDANGRPTTLLAESGNMASDTTGTKTASISSLDLVAGAVYWIGIRATAAISIQSIHTSGVPDINGGSPATSLRKTLARTVTFATGAPNPWVWNSAEIGAGAAHHVWLKEA